MDKSDTGNTGFKTQNQIKNGGGGISKMKKLKQSKNKKHPTYKTRKRSNNNFTKRGELMSSRRDNACSSCSITVNAKPYTRLKIDLYLPC